MSDTTYEITIHSNRSWFHLDWHGLWEYRDLLFLLVRRDFVAKYKQTVLGPAWFILQPLLTTIVFTVIFGKVAKIPTDGLPPTLFYLCGLVPWSYFSQCLNGASTSLVGNAGLFSKVYFPRLVVPLSGVLSNLIAFAIQLTTFLGFWVYFKLFTAVGPDIKPNMMLMALPLLLLETAALGLGVGLWMSALTAKYRDFTHLLGFLTQLWMYATPIIYPLSKIPARWQVVAVLNPMAGIVESYKYAFMGAGTVKASYLLISAAITLFLLLTGVLVFNKVERTFVDTV